MSTIKRFPLSYLSADVEVIDTVALEVLWENPEAILDLVYGTARRIVGACVPHDHAESGGESLLRAIVQHSFATYIQTLRLVGIPLGPPLTGSFAKVVRTDGTIDRSGAKRLYCEGCTLPGGVTSVRVDLVEFHETAGLPVTLVACFRPLSSVNFKLGVTPGEVFSELTYTTVGSGVFANQSVTIDGFDDLGDPTLDREVEFSLWLASDLDATNEQRICEVSVVPRAFSSSSRDLRPTDLVQPQISARELKAGIGVLTGQLAGKIRETYNGLNRSLWGTTPGLTDRLAPDRRRRYRETIEAAHSHQGRIVPTVLGGVFSDGAAMRDTQSMGFLAYLGETLPLVSGTPPLMDKRPNQGAFLHFTQDLSIGWVRYQFRRSVPAGVGALLFRFGAHPGFFYSADSFDTSQRLLVSIAIIPIGGGADIVTRLSSGPYISPLDPTEVQFGFVEVEPTDDPAYLSSASLVPANKKGWNRGAEILETDRTAAQMLPVIYRVSDLVRAQLTYPPERETDPYRPTQDYDVKIRFKMINSANLCDSEAGLLWLKCENEPGY